VSFFFCAGYGRFLWLVSPVSEPFPLLSLTLFQLGFLSWVFIPFVFFSHSLKLRLATALFAPSACALKPKGSQAIPVFLVLSLDAPLSVQAPPQVRGVRLSLSSPQTVLFLSLAAFLVYFSFYEPRENLPVAPPLFYLIFNRVRDFISFYRCFFLE